MVNLDCLFLYFGIEVILFFFFIFVGLASSFVECTLALSCQHPECELERLSISMNLSQACSTNGNVVYWDELALYNNYTCSDGTPLYEGFIKPNQLCNSKNEFVIPYGILHYGELEDAFHILQIHIFILPLAFSGERKVTKIVGAAGFVVLVTIRLWLCLQILEPWRLIMSNIALSPTISTLPTWQSGLNGTRTLIALEGTIENVRSSIGYNYWLAIAVLVGMQLLIILFVSCGMWSSFISVEALRSRNCLTWSCLAPGSSNWSRFAPRWPCQRRRTSKITAFASSQLLGPVDKECSSCSFAATSFGLSISNCSTFNPGWLCQRRQRLRNSKVRPHSFWCILSLSLVRYQHGPGKQNDVRITRSDPQSSTGIPAPSSESSS